MNTDFEFLKNINIYHQYLSSYDQFLILDAYSRIKRSKNEK